MEGDKESYTINYFYNYLHRVKVYRSSRIFTPSLHHYQSIQHVSMMFKADTYKDTKLTMTEQGYVYFEVFNNWLLHKKF